MFGFLCLILTSSAVFSVFSLVLLAVSPLLAGRYSPAVRRALWVMLFAFLLMPTGLLFKEPPVDVSVGRTRTILYRPASPSENSPSSGGEATLGDPVLLEIRKGRSAAPAIDSGTLFGWIWLDGCVLFLSQRLIRHHRFMRHCRRWTRAPGEAVLAALERARAETGCKRKLRAVLCECVGGPMLAGLFRPRILLPCREYGEEELRCILTHELLHHRRGDLWVRLLLTVCRSAHWFNPLLIPAEREALLGCELACDSGVVALSGEDGGPLLYAETLLHTAAGLAGTTLTTGFGGGERRMKKRIRSIMDRREKKKSAGPVITAAALLLLCGSAFAISPAAAVDLGGFFFSDNREAYYLETFGEGYKDMPLYELDPEVYGESNASLGYGCGTSIPLRNGTVPEYRVSLSLSYVIKSPQTMTRREQENLLRQWPYIITAHFWDLASPMEDFQSYEFRSALIEALNEVHEGVYVRPATLKLEVTPYSGQADVS